LYSFREWPFIAFIYIFTSVLIHLDQHFIERGPYRSERERTLEIVGGDRNANCLIYHTCLGSINRGLGLYNQLSPLQREPRTRAGVEKDGNAPLTPEIQRGKDCLRGTVCETRRRSAPSRRAWRPSSTTRTKSYLQRTGEVSK
jgi:hypothetical protein